MALNGLDSPAVSAAIQSVFDDHTNWFLLNYLTRDEIQVWRQGKGTIADIRETLREFDEKSPIFGGFQHKKKKVALTYIPQGTSRLLQARVAVHLAAFHERFPHDDAFSFNDPADLSDVKLSNPVAGKRGFVADGGDGKGQRRRLTEILEDPPEEDPAATRPKTDHDLEQPMNAGRISHDSLPGSRSGRGGPTIPSNAALQNGVRTDGGLANRTSLEHTRARSGAANPEPFSTSLAPGIATSYQEDPLDAGPHSMIPTRAEFEAEMERRFAIPEVRPSTAGNASSSSSFKFKPKVKLAPRPTSRTDQVRSANLPSNAKVFTNPLNLVPGFRSARVPQAASSVIDLPTSHADEGSQDNRYSKSSQYNDKDFLQYEPEVVTQKRMPNWDRPRSRNGSIMTLPAKFDAEEREISQEKLRLMKALEKRRKHQANKKATNGAAKELPKSVPIPKPEKLQSEDFEGLDTSDAMERYPNDQGIVKIGAADIEPEQILIPDGSLKEPSELSTEGLSDPLSNEAIQVQPMQKVQSYGLDVHSGSGFGFTEEQVQASSVEPINQAQINERSVIVDQELHGNAQGPLPQQGLGPAHEQIDSQELDDESLAMANTRKSNGAESRPATESVYIVGGYDLSSLVPPSGIVNPQTSLLSRLQIPDDLSQENDSAVPALRASVLDHHIKNDLWSPMGEKDVVIEEATPIKVTKSSPISAQALTPMVLHRTTSAGSVGPQKNFDSQVSQVGGEQVNTFKSQASENASPASTVGKKTGMSSLISQRIRALEKFSTSPVTAPGPDRSVITPSLVSERKTSLNTPPTSARGRENLQRPTLNFYPSGTAIRSTTNPTATTQRQGQMSPEQSLRQQDVNTRPTTSQGDKASMVPSAKPGPSHQPSHSISSMFSNLTKTGSIEQSSRSRKESLDVARNIPRTKSAISSENLSTSAETKSKKKGGFFQRLSKTFNSSSKNTAASKTPTPAVPPLPTENIVGYSQAPSPQIPAVHSPRPLANDHLIVGERNFQFPDTLLWKRRYLEISPDGFLHLRSATLENASKTAARKFHMTDFYIPFLPDREREEMPHSIWLELKDGSILQCACENTREQLNTIQVLRSAWEAHGSS